MKSDLRKMKKRRRKRDPLKFNNPEKGKIRETLVRLLWRAAAPGLTPIRLPRAWQSGSRPGQTFLPINGITTRAFPRPLLLTTPPRAFPRPILLTTPCVLDYAHDIVFLSHPPYFVYQLPAPLPGNSVIIAITMNMWIVLFTWHTPRGV